MRLGHIPLKPPKIAYEAGPFSEESLSNEFNVVILVARGEPLRSLPYGAEIAARARRYRFTPEATEPFMLDLPNSHGTRLALAYVDEAMEGFALLTLARRLIALQAGATRLCFASAGLSPAQGARALEALVSAALASSGLMPDLRRRPRPRNPLLELRISGRDIRPSLPRLVAEARGNHLARYLTSLPPDRLTPGYYRREILKMASGFGWQTRFYDENALRALGAGAFLAVTRGSSQRDAGILRLRYQPKIRRSPQVALVGKGICFDTGGVNLKPARSMYGMHEDMEGSAVALGTLAALTELKAPFAVDAWLALAQNDIGPDAYRQNQVVHALNGTAIEVVHTDAEGRMVLADTLTLAARTKPRLIIDYATLTGACVYALGTRYSGLATNRPDWWPLLIEAGRRSGERVWPFPLDPDYDDELKSDLADVKQCTLEGEADHILAASFLQRFAGKQAAWIHLDLSAGRHKGGLAHIPTDVTGFGVRYTLALLLDGLLPEAF